MYYKLRGVFYPLDSKMVISGEIYLENNYWIFKKNDGSLISFYNLYLDSDKKVTVPKTDNDSLVSESIVLKIIKKYETLVIDKEKNIELKKFSPSYDMEYKIAKKYLLEYKKIYFNYFTSNSYKYIFED
jgi:hypothetical protein